MACLFIQAYFQVVGAVACKNKIFTFSKKNQDAIVAITCCWKYNFMFS